MAESFFQLLKRERICQQIYSTRQDARADVFNYIEMFYNPKRRHTTAGDVSPIESRNDIPNGSEVSSKPGSIRLRKKRPQSTAPLLLAI